MKSIRSYLLLIGLLILLGIGTPIAVLGQKKLDKKERTYKLPPVPRKQGKAPSKGADVFDLLNQAHQQVQKNPGKALQKVQKALRLSFAEKNPRGQAYAYNSLGAINYGLSRYEESIRNYSKALDLFQRLDEPAGLYHAQRQLPRAYDGAENYDQALEAYFVFLEVARSSNATEDVIATQRHIARIYYNLGKYELALQRYETALQLEKSQENPAGVVTGCNEIGRVYARLNDTAQALANYRQAAEVAQRSGIGLTGEAFENISQIYRQNQNYSQELNTRQQAIESTRSLGDKKAEAYNSLEVARLLLAQNNSDEAIPYLKNSINLTSELGELEDKGEAYGALAEAYEQQGDFEKALTSLKQQKAVEDTLQLAILSEVNARENLSRELDRQEAAIQALEQQQALHESEMQQQRLITALSLGAIAILLVSGFFVLRSHRARRRANQLLALKSLRSQMNPHFIFNSLNSVNSFISKQDERAANRYLSAFSRLMRQVMEHSSHEFVSLMSELEVLRLYLELEHVRFQDKFDYEIELDPGLNPEEIQIPPMLVQPYLENAIWHGLRYKEAPGNLTLRFTREQEFLVATIEDDGIGRKLSQELKTKNQRTHRSEGLRITAERLRLLNELYKTQLEVTLEDVYPERQHTGTRVTLKVPYQIPEP
ncbi:MAG: tetratricopeptide repeat protein [Bacteroidota bacterium]